MARKGIEVGTTRHFSDLKQFDFLQECTRCTCAIFVQNLSDFCMRSDEKSTKFSVGKAQESTVKIATYQGNFGNIEIKLRPFAGKTAN